MSKGFYDDFNDNMAELGLPAPRTLFGSLATATATISAMVRLVQVYGTKVTVAEMVGTLPGAAVGAGGGAVGVATAASEALLVIGALSGSFYVGACIGSLAVATGKALSGGTSIGDCVSAATLAGIPTPQWLIDTLATSLALRGAPRRGTGGSRTAIA